MKIFSVMFALCFVFVTTPLLADTHTWIGGAGGLWSVSANWTGGVPTTGEGGPDGTVVEFGSNTSSVMNIPGLVVDQIRFTGSNNVIGGTTALGLSGAAAQNNILDSAGGNTLATTLPITLVGNSNIFVNVSAGTLTLAGNISGGRGLRFISSGANGTTITSATNSYTGTTTVATGTLSLNSASSNVAIVGNIEVGTGSGGPAATLVLLQSTEIANTSNVSVLGNGTFNLSGFSDVIGALTVQDGTVSLGSGSLDVQGVLSINGGTISGTTGTLVLRDNVISSSTATSTSTISARVSLNGDRTFTVGDSSQATDLNLSNIISDGAAASSIRKAGLGTMLLSTGTSNTYTNGTFVNDGVLLLDGASASVIPAGAVTVGDGTGTAASAVLRLGQVSEIANTATVTVSADGLFDLNGFSDTVAGVTINSGSVTCGAGTLSPSSLTMTGGSLTASATVGLNLGGPITATSSATGSATITANIALGATRNITVTPGTSPEFVINGLVSGVGFGFNKLGTGTMRLTGSQTNTYTGTTTITTGVLQLLQTSGRTIVGPVVIGNNTDPAGTATLQELIQNDIDNNVAITINSSGVMDLNGFSDTIAALSGSGAINLPVNSTFTTNSDDSTSAFSGTISGVGFFRKSGSGTLTLTGSNPLTGRMICNNGTLVLNSTTPNTVVQSAMLQIGDNAGAANTAVLRLSAANQISDTTAVEVRLDGQFDTNSFNETLAAISVDRGSIVLGTGTLVANGAVTMNDGSISPASGTLSIGGSLTTTFATAGSTVSSALVLNATRNITVGSGATQPELQISGVISDGATASGIVKLGTGTLRLNPTANTFTGASTLLAGVTQLQCSSDTAFRGPLTIGNSTDAADTAILRDLNQFNLASTVDLTINASGRFDMNGFGDRCGTLNGSGSISQGTGNLTLNNSSSGIYNGVISGTGAVNMNGTGTQIFNGNNTYNGATNVTNGILVLNGNQTGSATVSANGTLSGNGTIGNTTVTGTLAPTNGPLKTGNLQFNATGKLNINLNSVTAGAFSAVTVTGTTTITAGAQLTISRDANVGAAGGVKLTAIDNDSNDAITGTFTNAAEGTTLTADSLPLVVSYVGGTGNDLVFSAVDVTPQVASNATALPNPASTGQTIQFMIVATDPNNTPLTITWDFGDGTTGSGATPTHSYPVAGVYPVAVIVSDGIFQVSSNVSVTVNVPKIGGGLDSDGDGFSDDVETATGTSPQDPTSTPIGGGAINPNPLTVSKASIKLTFSKPNSDAIALAGTLPVPAGLVVANQRIAVDIGGVTKSFTLTAKGIALATDASFKIQVKAKKGVVSAQTSKFAVSLKKGLFANALADEGLTNATNKGSTKSVVVTGLFNGRLFQKTQPLSYKATQGKSGMAKSTK